MSYICACQWFSIFFNFTNSGAMNNLYVCIFILLVYHKGKAVRLLGQIIYARMCVLNRWCEILFHKDYTNLHTHQQCLRVPISLQLANLVWLYFLIFGQSVRWEMVFWCRFNLYFAYYELFICLRIIVIAFFLVYFLFMSFIHSSVRFWFIFLLNFLLWVT